MANNHTKQYVTCDGHTRHALGGYFTSNGTTTVLTTVKGVGFSVTRSNTGVFTVCLSSTYPGLITLVPSNTPMSNTIPSAPVLISASTVSATNTVTITCYSITTGAAAATELTAGTGISFFGLFANSSLTT